MPASRKSDRTRNSVDYSKFADRSDDDDFRDSTPPPTKKSRICEQSRGKMKERLANDCDKKRQDNGQTRNKERLPVVERKFEKDMKAALELSKLSSQPEADEAHLANQKSVASESVTKSAVETQDFNSNVESETKQTSSETKPKVDGDETNFSPEVENLSESDSESDDDFAPSDSDSEYEENMSNKPVAKARPGPNCSKTEQAAGSKRTPAKTKAANKGPTRRTPCASSKTNPSSPSRGGTSRQIPALEQIPLGPRTSSNSTPAWTPPARVTISDKVIASKSPGNYLRLGLSRSQRVKPLHSNVKGQ